MGVVIVSGTGTGVGKTVVSAALAVLARARGESVAVVKPAQTGEPPGGGGDLSAIGALTGLAGVPGGTDLHELARFADPLSPEAAARTAGLPPVDLRRAASHVAALAGERQNVIVEGAGGLLVRYDPAGTTIADLAAMLQAPVLVVAEAGLGTLNATALTLEALGARKLTCAGVVIGCWPAEPGLAELCNLDDLAALAGQPVAGILPAGAGRLDPGAFAEMAARSLGPALGGTLDAAGFRTSAFAAAGPAQGRAQGPQTIADL
jgi:dethiobiotin synthetase